MFNLDSLVGTNKEVDEFINLIEQIVQMPDDTLSDDKVDMILGAMRGSITEKVKEETIQALLQEMKGDSKQEVQTMLQELETSLDELIEEIKPLSSAKEKLIRGLLNVLIDFMREAVERHGEYDTMIYFQLTHPNAKIPTYAHDTDAGADVYIPEDITIAPGARGQKVDTGFKMAMAPGWMISVCPRSGLSYKTTMRIANTPGTIDAGYRDNVGILIDNLSDEAIEVKAGERLAQFVLHPVYRFKGQVVENVETIGENRGGGFGSTGK